MAARSSDGAAHRAHVAFDRGEQVTTLQDGDCRLRKGVRIGIRPKCTPRQHASESGCQHGLPARECVRGSAAQVLTVVEHLARD